MLVNNENRLTDIQSYILDRIHTKKALHNVNVIVKLIYLHGLNDFIEVVNVTDMQ